MGYFVPDSHIENLKSYKYVKRPLAAFKVQRSEALLLTFNNFYSFS